MTISFITLVFSLSLNSPPDKKKQLELIENIISYDFSKYEAFVERIVEHESKKYLPVISQAMQEKLDAEKLLIFGLHHIYKAFSKPAHIGKILTKDLVLVKPSDSTINQFEALNGLDLTQNVQFVIPQSPEISEEIIFFLSGIKDQAGRRVDNVSIAVSENSFVAQSFLPNTDTSISLYFEVPENIRTGGSPVFNADFPAKIVSIPDSSFIAWLTERDHSTDIFTIDNKELIWLPELDILPNGFKEQKLGLLAKELAQEIKQASPEHKNISILGASIPGILFIYAAPSLLLAFFYYLKNHSSHLINLVRDPENTEYFEQFSWMPLSMNKYWGLDFFLSNCIFPIASLITLSVQLNQFGSQSFWSVTVLSVSCLLCIWLYFLTYNNIITIRSYIRR